MPWERDPGAANQLLGRVEDWQSRATGERSADRPSASAGTDSAPVLEAVVSDFQGELKRSLARRINHWAQGKAREYYRHDLNESAQNDHWPTYYELLASPGDDCDGLDMMAYGLLLDFGFSRDRVFRLIGRRDRDGVYHMVTVWFEILDDPWVLDATGAMTREMIRLSQVRGWQPTAIFNENGQFTVEERGDRDGENPTPH